MKLHSTQFWFCLAIIVSFLVNCQDLDAVLMNLLDGSVRIEASEIQTGSTHEFYKGDPSVASDLKGNFLIVWDQQEVDQAHNIYAQSFDQGGRVLGSEWKINQQAFSQPGEKAGSSADLIHHYLPQVVINQANDKVILWSTDQEVRFQILRPDPQNRLDPKIEEVEVRIPVSKETLNGGKRDLCFDQNGNLLLALVVEGGDILLMKYSLDGQKKWEKRVSAQAKQKPLLRSLPTGDFYLKSDNTIALYGPEGESRTKNREISLRSNILDFEVNAQNQLLIVESPTTDHPNQMIGTIYTSDLKPLGKPFKINSRPLGPALQKVDLAVGPEGDFVVVWGDQTPQNSGGNIFARRFNPQGVTSETEFRVNFFNHSFEGRPSVVVIDQYQFVVTWQNWNKVSQEHQVVAHLYHLKLPLPRTITPAISPTPGYNRAYCNERQKAFVNSEQGRDRGRYQPMMPVSSGQFETDRLTTQFSGSACSKFMEADLAVYEVKLLPSQGGYAFLEFNPEKIALATAQSWIREADLEIPPLKESELKTFALRAHLLKNYGYLFGEIVFTYIPVPA
ncbi:MAG: hypothetical protein IV090_17320 [Candidatus Sericytochromatia bacterium]|nr:hypothetical protein [Candidatus Sericytochromatia bacterium]